MKKTSIIIMISLISIILLALNAANLSIATTDENTTQTSNKTEEITTSLFVKSIKLSKTKYTYNGEVQKPEVIIKNNEGTILTNKTDYEIIYSNKKSKNVGTFTITVKFIGNYKDEKEKSLTYKINPAGTTIKKLTSNTKGFTATWNKQTKQTTGYQLKYWLSGKSEDAKKKRIKNNNTLSKTIKSLKANKKYTVQIRTYKNINGTNYYSSWSKYKRIKTLNGGVIYLTFDDGPTTNITPKVLDILKENNVKATFFILNYNSEGEKLVKREYEEGHTIGIHGYSHDYYKIYKSEDIYMKNITKLQKKIKKSTGYNSTITRFPGGSSNTVSSFNPGIMSRLTKLVVNKGYTYFDWNISSGDAGGAKNGQQMYKNVIKGLSKNGQNVVLMHDFASNSKVLDALPKIIKYGKKNGYTFSKITKSTPMITHGVNN